MKTDCACGDPTTTLANGVWYCTHCYFRNLDSVIYIAVARARAAVEERERLKYQQQFRDWRK